MYQMIWLSSCFFDKRVKNKKRCYKPGLFFTQAAV
jgi:hypothetical protein